MKIKRIYYCLLAVALLLPVGIQAQVEIGSGKQPETFSVLEIDATNIKGGLRLPQLTTLVCDSLKTVFLGNPAKNAEAKGLTVYNIDTDCVWYWNGAKWVTQCAPVAPAAPASITTYTNVMYNFQHQELEAYDYGSATAFQWQYSTDDGNTWVDIAGATSSTYTIPANTYTTSAFGDTYKANVVFQCLTNGTAAANNNIMDMFFIKTTDDLGNYLTGYGEDANGVKYLELGAGSGGQTVPEGSSRKIKVALLNLGQSADWDGNSQTETGLPPVYIPNNDAADLGDIYQWGRVADGHQQTKWSKTTTHENTISPMNGGVNTSEYAARTNDYNDPNLYNGNQQLITNDDSKKFIYTKDPLDSDWGLQNTESNKRWGDGTLHDIFQRHDISYNDWNYPDNNPCPTGWYVPSTWNFWDLFMGTGKNINNNAGLKFYHAINNDWTKRVITIGGSKFKNDAFGGMLIANFTGEMLFLPFSGGRHAGNAGEMNPGLEAYVWSSTARSLWQANYMDLRNGDEVLLESSSDKSYGMSVRCVQE
jgi:uncharacterized protein (TIGR02145 family)